jgi:hypothetical protein
VKTLTTTAWRRVCRAAERKPVPEAEARASLARLLFVEYPAFTYDPVRAAEDRKRAKRMLKRLDAFAADHRAQFKNTDDIKTERDRFYIERLRRRALSLRDGAIDRKDANTGQKNRQREALYLGLCEMWLDYFQGPERPPVRAQLPPPGPQRTPLVNFILTAMSLVMPKGELPDPDTVRGIIDRKYKARVRLDDEIRRLVEKGLGRYTDLA